MTTLDRIVAFGLTWFIVVVLIDLACQYFGWPLPRAKNFREWFLRLYWIFDPSISRRSIAIGFAFRIVTSIIVMILTAMAVMSLP
jgi:ABC-type multidrug transport system permease subunit